MNESEYKTLRDEMLQRSRAAESLPTFSITAAAILYSWLATQAPYLNFENPFFFVLIGQIIISFAFFRYLLILKTHCDRGSYLATFYELSKVKLLKDDINLEITIDTQDNPSWHILNRVNKYIINTSKIEIPIKWARKSGIILFPFLTLAVWIAPLYLLEKSISLNNPDQLITLIISFLFSIVSFVYLMGNFLTMDNFMFKNMSKWILLRAILEEKPNIITIDKLKKYITKFQKVYETSG